MYRVHKDDGDTELLHLAINKPRGTQSKAFERSIETVGKRLPRPDLLLCSMTHYDITMGKYVAGDAHYDITMGIDIDRDTIVM